ncbi:hypothetical protein [Dipodfec virus UOA04_Rod_618]|nr:hypothetical protein [Dipodfec virus UOA04_Rod_618]
MIHIYPNPTLSEEEQDQDCYIALALDYSTCDEEKNLSRDELLCFVAKRFFPCFSEKDSFTLYLVTDIVPHTVLVAKRADLATYVFHRSTAVYLCNCDSCVDCRLSYAVISLYYLLDLIREYNSEVNL